MDDAFDLEEDAERVTARASLQRIKESILSSSYRDGLEEGEASTTQAGFDLGFENGAIAGFTLGQLLGRLKSAAAIRPQAVGSETALGLERCVGDIEARLRALIKLSPVDAATKTPDTAVSELNESLPSLCTEVTSLLRSIGLDEDSSQTSLPLHSLPHALPAPQEN